MAQRERHIDGVRLYSDKLDGDNDSKSKTVQTYKKVQSTTKTVTKVGANPTKTTVSKRSTITTNFGLPRNSASGLVGKLKKQLLQFQELKKSMFIQVN
jgi:hypothetical protein